MDIVKLLPDSVANQIAAGEVIQRPASVVKELLENSIDAGAEKIQLIIKDAGKKLIQVIDDGRGMTESDARMCFERHATSKISKADDLFSLRTKGFRGEALPSIAAIAHVELKTRTENRDMGTKIVIQGSKVEDQEPVVHPVGSSFSVKNLFYNVPARRKFLKSDNAESKHIIEEFQRVALGHPNVSFTLFKDERELFNLPKASARQRIVAMFGSNYDQRLVPVEEVTDVLAVKGFVGKPEFAKRTRGDQYLFMNKRFIKNGYLHHAILKAYDNLLPEKTHPSYFLFIEVDPARVDVNIHPTKTEVKFDEERSVYMILNSAIRQSLGKYNIAPSLDFESESSFSIPPLQKDRSIRIPEIIVDKSFNPFETEGSSSVKTSFPKSDRIKGDWKELYEVGRKLNTETSYEQEEELDLNPTASKKLLHFFNGQYILTTIKSGIVVIDPRRAHERILYEEFVKNIALNAGSSQQLLFPEVIDFRPQEMEVIQDNLETLRKLGFDIEEFGKQSVKVNGLPSGVTNSDTEEFFGQWVEEFIEESSRGKNRTETLARTMARRLRMKPSGVMSNEEMEDIIDRLFATEQPYHCPNGKPTVVNITAEEIEKKFNKRR
ncbi:MAG: DNA mismatch repair endonuclease MutL [Flavobacteriales bacterium]|nr:DNA mismatch repair endonuclease MutL [Flavobacteriales bacterium]